MRISSVSSSSHLHREVVTSSSLQSRQGGTAWARYTTASVARYLTDLEALSLHHHMKDRANVPTRGPPSSQPLFKVTTNHPLA
jgi:hypothetical protein